MFTRSGPLWLSTVQYPEEIRLRRGPRSRFERRIGSRCSLQIRQPVTSRIRTLSENPSQRNGKRVLGALIGSEITKIHLPENDLVENWTLDTARKQTRCQMPWQRDEERVLGAVDWFKRRQDRSVENSSNQHPPPRHNNPDLMRDHCLGIEKVLNDRGRKINKNGSQKPAKILRDVQNARDPPSTPVLQHTSQNVLKIDRRRHATTSRNKHTHKSPETWHCTRAYVGSIAKGRYKAAVLGKNMPLIVSLINT